MTKYCGPAVVISAALLAHATTASAQCGDLSGLTVAARRGALTGIVVDSARRPIDGAEVVVSDPLRRTRTGADGQFTIEKLAAGPYTALVRKIGYLMVVGKYNVPENGAALTFCLALDIRRLAPTITSAGRLGLSGIVGDSTLKPLAQAEVRVLAGGSPTTTDSSGAFHVSLKPGTYAVVVSKPGYGRELLSVTIPKDSGREIAVWLGAMPPNPNRLFAAYDDMRIRRQIANPNRSALVTSEDLTKKYDLFFAAQSAIRDKLPPECAGLIDGGPYTLPIAAIPKEEVAMMEIYLAPPIRASQRSINNRGSTNSRVLSTVPPRTDTGCGRTEVYIWLKK